MGIAVSLHVRPSPRLRWLQAGFALSAIVIPLALWPPGVPLGALVMVSGLLALCHPPLLPRNGKGCRIDISDHGAFRLTVYLNHILPADSPASLQPGAVLWPWLLMLPLRLADGRTVRLLVLPDSVAPGAFRALSVACRACAARDL